MMHDYLNILFRCAAISLMITAIYTAFMHGNILGWMHTFFANWFDIILGNRWSKIIQKPLWDCLPCMASIWSVVITRSFDIHIILIVCGINAIIEKLIVTHD